VQKLLTFLLASDKSYLYTKRPIADIRSGAVTGRVEKQAYQKHVRLFHVGSIDHGRLW